MTFENITSENIQELDSEIDIENQKKVEAALFLAGRLMSLQELVSLTDINPILLKKTLYDLKDKYKDSGVNLIEKENSWKMDVAESYVWMVNKLATGTSEFKKAEQETLAMIAYKQPIKQSAIIKIRGNKAYDHIKRFLEIGLINKKKTGHTYELSLTEAFHEYFHLNKEGS
ncbi:MAG: SMC-Scp complex subunit ScpB [Nanoarchaeota archaeon]